MFVLNVPLKNITGKEIDQTIIQVENDQKQFLVKTSEFEDYAHSFCGDA